MKIESGIYGVFSPTGNVYVGQSINVINRLNSYKKCNSHNKFLNASLRKHSINSHSFVVLKECSIEDLNKWERFFQDFYDNVGLKLMNGRKTVTDDKSGYMLPDIIEKIKLSHKGLTLYKDKDNNNFLTNKEDTRVQTGELVGIRTGIIPVLDENGKRIYVTSDDENLLFGKYTHIFAGKVNVKDKNGEIINISVYDERWTTRELFSIHKNTTPAINNNGENIGNISVYDERFVTGEITGTLKGKIIVKDNEGNKFSVNKNDERYLSGELVSVNKGSANAKDSSTGQRLGRIELTDERWLTGEIVGINKGWKVTDEFREICRKRFKGKQKSEISKQKMKEVQENTCYINNPILGIKKRIKIGDDIPSGWLFGDLKGTTKWIYNIDTNKRTKIGINEDVPYGYLIGCPRRKKEIL